MVTLKCSKNVTVKEFQLFKNKLHVAKQVEATFNDLIKNEDLQKNLPLGVKAFLYSLHLVDGYAIASTGDYTKWNESSRYDKALKNGYKLGQRKHVADNYSILNHYNDPQRLLALGYEQCVALNDFMCSSGFRSHWDLNGLGNGDIVVADRFIGESSDFWQGRIPVYYNYEGFNLEQRCSPCFEGDYTFDADDLITDINEFSFLDSYIEDNLFKVKEALDTNNLHNVLEDILNKFEQDRTLLECEMLHFLNPSDLIKVFCLESTARNCFANDYDPDHYLHNNTIISMDLDSTARYNAYRVLSNGLLQERFNTVVKSLV